MPCSLHPPLKKFDEERGRGGGRGKGRGVRGWKDNREVKEK